MRASILDCAIQLLPAYNQLAVGFVSAGNRAGLRALRALDLRTSPPRPRTPTPGWGWSRPVRLLELVRLSFSEQEDLAIEVR